MVSLFGKAHVQAIALPVAREDRAGQHLNLRPGIIDVKLPFHSEAGGGQQIGQAVSYRCPAAVANVEGPGGIGTHKLDLHFFACADLALAILRARLEDFGTDALPKTFREEKVEVARTCDLGSFYDVGIGIEAATEDFRYIPGLAAERAGQGKGNRRCQISKGGLDRIFPDHLESLDRPHLACLRCLSQGLPQILGDLPLEFGELRHFRPAEYWRNVSDISHRVNKKCSKVRWMAAGLECIW